MEHRFLDEWWDTTFYNKYKEDIVWQPWVSKAFYMGMTKIKTDIKLLRKEIEKLEIYVAQNFSHIKSVQKRLQKTGKFFFHAKDDIPEIREIFLDFIANSCDFSCELIIARKKTSIFKNRHQEKDVYFYADILWHLLKNKFTNDDKLILNIAKRWSSTSMKNLETAKTSAMHRAIWNAKNKKIFPDKNIVFNTINPHNEPLLSIPDYVLWAVQRLCERWEIQYYEKIKGKLPVIIDIYDDTKFKNFQNYYNAKQGKFLTIENFIQ